MISYRNRTFVFWWNAMRLTCHHRQEKSNLCCGRPTSNQLNESQNISRVSREVNQQYVHLMATSKAKNNHSWPSAWWGQRSSGSPNSSGIFLKYLWTFACYLKSRTLLPTRNSLHFGLGASSLISTRQTAWRRKRTAYQCPLAGVGGGWGVLYIKEDSRPFTFRMFKVKQNLLLSGTVCSKCFKSGKRRRSG